MNFASRETHIHCLHYWSEQRPDSVFLTQPISENEVVEYTWQEVLSQVKSVAIYLKSTGLPPGSHIGIFGKNSAHWIMADLAIWMAGFVSIPIYPSIGSESAKHIFSHGDIKALIVGKLDGISDSWKSVKNVIPNAINTVRLPLSPDIDNARTWDAIVADKSPNQALKLPAPSAIATIMYTSGSTGLPKGVMHTFETMMHVARSTEEEFGLGYGDRFISYLPLAHAAERATVESAGIYTGGHIFFTHSLDSFVEDLQRAKPTFFLSVPRLWIKFYQGVNEKIPLRLQSALLRIPLLNRSLRKKVTKTLGLQYVRYAVTGSAAVPVEIVKWYRSMGVELLEAYAMTENFGYSHCNRVGDYKEGYVGHPQPSVDCKISDEGEVLVKSPANMIGYYKDAAKTHEDITSEGYLRTGDLGELDPDGRLRITGRIKDLFKTSKGKYVAPVPIEQKIGAHPAVEAVCVGGSSLPQPVAFVTLAQSLRDKVPLDAATTASLEADLSAALVAWNQTLEAHEKISFMVIAGEAWNTDNDMLTPTLKIKRRSIENHFEPKLSIWSELKQPVVWEEANAANNCVGSARTPDAR